MERSKGEAGSPLATVEEIQRRLVRPSSLPPASFWNDVRSREDLHSEKEEAKTTGMENKKLEDYLDPALLSVVSSKIGRQKKDVMKMTKQKMEIEKFQWPFDDLKVFVDDTMMVKTKDWSSEEVIDLKSDNEID